MVCVTCPMYFLSSPYSMCAGERHQQTQVTPLTVQSEWDNNRGMEKFFSRKKEKCTLENKITFIPLGFDHTTSAEFKAVFQSFDGTPEVDVLLCVPMSLLLTLNIYPTQKLQLPVEVPGLFPH